MVILDQNLELIHSTLNQNRANDNFVCGVVEGFYGRPWTTDQRKRLFKRSRKLGLNTYLYAPKDDAKHRMFWRDLYSVEEADHLTSLIQSAEESNVTFVYALSPGLDMTYSSTKELTCLKRKLEQVASFGCRAFALLFDDIEVDMSEADKEIFQSFAHAHVSVTNEVFQHLGESRFLFCPTEYCGTRAVPTVSQSEYLNTIGNKLLPCIDVMWTGPKVVSRKISIESIQEITAVIQRPPVIWDNIHANDYDHKRLFLGPYEGRSSELIPYLRGVLTNPNCEFEANYIAMHTLAQWSKSNVGGVKKDLVITDNPVSSDIKLETEGDYSSDEEVPVHLRNLYKPRQALIAAIKDWAEEVCLVCPATGVRQLTPIGAILLEQAVISPITEPTVATVPVSTCMAITATTDSGPWPLAATGPIPIPQPASSSVIIPTNANEFPLSNSLYLQPVMNANPVNSFRRDSDSSGDSDETDSCIDVQEPMDCAITPGSTPVNTVIIDGHCSDCGSGGVVVKACCDQVVPGSLMMHPSDSSSDMQVDSDTEPLSVLIPNNPVCANCSSNILVQQPCSSQHHGQNSHVMQTDAITDINITTTDIITKLPSCHDSPLPQTSRSCNLSEEDLILLVDLFYMPFEHGSQAVDLLTSFHWLKTNAHTVTDAKCKKPSIELLEGAATWNERAVEFHQKIAHVYAMIDRFCCIPNMSMVCDLFPYMWDMKMVLALLVTFVQWLGLGHVPYISVCYMQDNPYTWANARYRDHFLSGDSEPWVFRGGLQAEFQRMLPVDGVADLLIPVFPQTPIPQIFNIRPYRSQDEAAVFEVCRKTCDDGVDGTEIFPDHPDLIGDKLVGAFVQLSPEYCFVVEDQEGICGYCLAALDSRMFQSKMEATWIPAMQQKYPKADKVDNLSPAEEITSSFHPWKTFLPDNLYEHYPSVVRMNFLENRIQDLGAPRRALCSAVLSLKANGSTGIYTEIPVGDRNIADFYSKLGFCEVPLQNLPDDFVVLGREFGLMMPPTT